LDLFRIENARVRGYRTNQYRMLSHKKTQVYSTVRSASKLLLKRAYLRLAHMMSRARGSFSNATNKSLGFTHVGRLVLG